VGLRLRPNASIGSARIARRAGTTLAITPMAMITTATAAKVLPSVALVSKSSAPIERERYHAASRPSAPPPPVMRSARTTTDAKGVCASRTSKNSVVDSGTRPALARNPVTSTSRSGDAYGSGRRSTLGKMATTTVLGAGAAMWASAAVEAPAAARVAGPAVRSVGPGARECVRLPLARPEGSTG